MTLTQVFNQVSVTTTSYSDVQTRLALDAGPLSAMVDYTRTGGTNLQYIVEVSPFRNPAVDDDTQWFTPADSSDGSAENEVTLALNDDRGFYDYSTRQGAANTTTFTGVTTGIRWVRVSARQTGGATGTLSLWIIHNPAPASATRPLD